MPRGRPRGSVSSGGPRIKGPMSAYSCFVKTCREEHKKMHPDENVQFGELAAQCSQRWKTMSDKEKEKFQEMADSDRARYNEAMKDYVPPPGAGGRRRRRRNRKEKDPNKPKRALSAFFYFAKDERPVIKEKNPDFSVGECAKELGRKWNEMDESSKAPYEKQAEEDRARYDKEMKMYKANGAGGPPPSKKMKASNGKAQEAPAREEEDDDEEEEEEESEGEEEEEDDYAGAD